MAANPLFIFGNDVGGFDSSVRFQLDGNFSLVQQGFLSQPLNVQTVFGAMGDGVTDDTLAIQRAVNFVARLFPGSFGRPVSLFFPEGLYNVTATITIPGAIAMFGEPVLSYCGSIIRQLTNGLHLFRESSAGNASIYMRDLGLKASGGSTVGIALFYSPSSVASGNSYYFDRCWFQTPEFYAINIEQGDDMQIVDCTFDVTAFKFIKVGTTTTAISNLAVRGNTFFFGASNAGTIDILGCDKGVITENRVYSNAPSPVPYFINSNNSPHSLVSDLIVADNTTDFVNILVATNVGNYTISGNRCRNSITPIVIAGGGNVQNVTIEGNYLHGTAGANGLIDSTGTDLSNSIIRANILIGNAAGTSAFGINVPTAASLSNRVGDNVFIGCTANTNLASHVANGHDSFNATAVINSFTLVAGATSTATVAIAGCALFDEVTLQPAALSWPLPVNVTVYAFVSAAGTVTIQYQNPSASSATVNAHQFSLRVRRAQ